MPVLYVLCALLLMGAWELVFGVVVIALSFGGGMPLQDIKQGLLIVAPSTGLAHFLLLLPFLILSSASAFYRERLKALLNIKPVAPPVESKSK